MAVYKPGLSVLEHAFASCKDLDNMLLSVDNVSKRELVLLCQYTRKRIIATCAGLLEVHEHPASDTENDTLSDWSSDSDAQWLDSALEDNLSVFDFEWETTDDSGREQESGQEDPESDNGDPKSGSEIKITDGEGFDLESKATVDFIHRTVIDFLRSPVQEGKIMYANLPPDFDAQVLYIKALLRKMRLVGSIKPPKHTLRIIDTIMEGVALAEDRTGMVQTGLCELIDRTMSIVDHGHPDWHPNSHWCTQWGMLAAKMQVRDQGRSRLSTSTSPRSSSRDSFYSATNEPLTQGDSNAAPTVSFSFLNFAASHGLSHCVKQTFQCREKSVGPEILVNILCCSTFVVSYKHGRDYLYPRPLKVIPEVLRQGGDPNAEFFARTIWREFLERMLKSLDNMLYWGHDAGKDSNVTKRLFSDHWDAITVPTIALIEHGADVNAIWTFHFFQTMTLSARGIEARPAHETMKSLCTFDIQLSALSAIRLCLSYEPVFPHIRELRIARGAEWYSRCTILEVISRDESEFVTADRKNFELSEQESKDFLELFEQYVALRGTGVLQVAAGLSRQISDFYDRLDEGRLKSWTVHMNPSRTRLRGSEWGTHTSRFRPGSLGHLSFPS